MVIDAGLVGQTLRVQHAAMRPHRFHVSNLAGDNVTVTGPEARHAASVLRLGVGDAVQLFDGQGGQCDGVIQAIDAASLVVAITVRGDTSSTVGIELTLATAIPKGPRADWMVEKCAELGVAVLQPIHFARSVVEPGMGKLERWRRLALSAAKQSGTARSMAIREPMPLGAFLIGLGESTCLFGVTQGGAPALIDRLSKLTEGSPPLGSLAILIGPEGGFTTEECLILDGAGVLPASWARSVLRIETAAIAAAAVFAAHVPIDPQ